MTNFSINRKLSRRRFLNLAAGSSITLASLPLLDGCGGGNSSASGVAVNTSRTVLTGNLSNQLTQHAQAIDDFSTIALRSSTAVDDAGSFLTSIGSRAATVPTAENFIQSVYYGYRTTKVLYERQIDMLIGLDNITYIGDVATTKNNLVGTASISNPQWGAAMMARSYKNIQFLAILMKHWQTSGIEPLMLDVQKETDASTASAKYIVLSFLFNEWVDMITANSNTATDPSWKLADTSTINMATIQSEAARIPAIIDALPLGPSYRYAAPATKAVVDEVLDSPTFKAFSGAFMDVISKLFNENSSSDIIDGWQKFPNLSSKGLKGAFFEKLQSKENAG